MGHTRLGFLPQTRKWRDVVEFVAAGANVPQIANATLIAAESAFSFVSNDSGYNQAVWLITQLGLAAKKENPLEYLRSQGVDIPNNTSLPGIAVALTEALETHSAANGGHSDLGELAQRALVDAVVQRMEPKLQQQSLFNLQAEHAQQALTEFGKQAEFGQLAREFYSRLTNECLNYWRS